jgi:hypothetical protein
MVQCPYVAWQAKKSVNAMQHSKGIAVAFARPFIYLAPAAGATSQQDPAQKWA